MPLTLNHMTTPFKHFDVVLIISLLLSLTLGCNKKKIKRYSILFCRLKDRNHLLAALSKMIDALDPNRWLPADFEQLDEGLYSCHNPLFNFSFRRNLSEIFPESPLLLKETRV